MACDLPALCDTVNPTPRPSPTREQWTLDQCGNAFAGLRFPTEAEVEELELDAYTLLPQTMHGVRWKGLENQDNNTGLCEFVFGRIAVDGLGECRPVFCNEPYPGHFGYVSGSVTDDDGEQGFADRGDAVFVVPFQLPFWTELHVHSAARACGDPL